MINYDKAIEFMLNHESINYSDFYYIGKNEEPNFMAHQKKLLSILEGAIKKRTKN